MVKKSKTAVADTKADLPTNYPEALRALIPSDSVADAYVDRVIDGLAFHELLDYAAAEGVHVSTIGDTGAGKTMAKQAWCAKRGWAYVNIPCNGALDPDTVFGTTDIIDGETVWSPGTLPLAVEHGFTLIDFDEVNTAPQRVMSVFNSLLDGRGVLTLLGVGGTKTITKHESVVISASWNEDYTGTAPLNEALKDRVCAIAVDWPYLREVEEQVIGFTRENADGTDEWVAATSLLDLAERLRKGYEAGDFRTPISTRKLQRFVFNAIDLGWNFAVTNFVNSFHAEERPQVREFFVKNQHALFTNFGIELVEEEF